VAPRLGTPRPTLAGPVAAGGGCGGGEGPGTTATAAAVAPPPPPAIRAAALAAAGQAGGGTAGSPAGAKGRSNGAGARAASAAAAAAAAPAAAAAAAAPAAPATSVAAGPPPRPLPQPHSGFMAGPPPPRPPAQDSRPSARALFARAVCHVCLAAGSLEQGMICVVGAGGRSGEGHGGPASLSSSRAGADAGVQSEQRAPAAARVRLISSNNHCKFTRKPMPPRPAMRHGRARSCFKLHFKPESFMSRLFCRPN
jgi:hypothetical protein